MVNKDAMFLVLQIWLVQYLPAPFHTYSSTHVDASHTLKLYSKFYFIYLVNNHGKTIQDKHCVYFPPIVENNKKIIGTIWQDNDLDMH